MSIKNTTYPVKLAGQIYDLRFDIQALTGAHASLKMLGFNRTTVWQLADTPYDLGEEIVLLQYGLNGAKRLQKDKELFSMDDMQDIMQQHLDEMAERLGELDPEEALAAFQKEQAELMDSIGTAVRGAIGFRAKKGHRDEPKQSGEEQPKN